MSGLQRSITVTLRGPFGRTHAPDLGWAKSPKLHGMQAVKGPPGSRLDRNFIDLVGRMAGALVNALHGLGAGRLRQAEHHA
jgi:hypothetical protein